jgi:hypothetical protein
MMDVTPKAFYDITIQGDPSFVLNLLSHQQWVDGIVAEWDAVSVKWSIRVNDTERADRVLLRSVLADQSLVVLEYVRQPCEAKDLVLVVQDQTHTLQHMTTGLLATH